MKYTNCSIRMEGVLGPNRHAKPNRVIRRPSQTTVKYALRLCKAFLSLIHLRFHRFGCLATGG